MTATITVPEYGHARQRRRVVPLAVAGAVIALAAAGFGARWYLTRATVPAVTGSFHTVAPIDLAVSIRKDGELQAVNNIDIFCQVEGQVTIQTIAKEGARVAKGEVMVTLDSAEISRKLQDAKLAMQKCEADLTMANEAKVIQEAKNLADLQGAQVELTLAQLDLAEYTDGKYPQSVKEAQRAVRMAEIGLQNKQEEFDQTVALYLKGYQELSEKKRAEVEVLQAQNELEKKQNDLEVLTKYTYQKESTDRKNKVVQAERKLARTNKENASNLAQKTADVSAKEEAFKTQKRLVEHLEKQLAFCEIKAPSDGLVVYSSSVTSAWWRDRPIGPGSQVRQQELLIRLPDTSSMKAVVKVPESLIGKLRADEKDPMRATVDIVGLGKRVTAKVTSVSVMADNSQRFWNPDNKEYPVELTLDETPPGLKPGKSVTAEIIVERLGRVLAVPLSAVYSVGTDRYVFVRDGSDGVTPAKVELGQSTDTHVQVAGGLTAGQQVLLLQVGQGRELLERAGIKTTAAEPTTRPAGGDGSPPAAAGSAPVATAQ